MKKKVCISEKRKSEKEKKSGCEKKSVVCECERKSEKRGEQKERKERECGKVKKRKKWV
jgi:hypothetical protein